MNEFQMYHDLRPNYEKSESFILYYRRIQKFLPNFPECVCRQWLYDHFSTAIQRYGWLDFKYLSFRKEIWTSERIIQKVKAWNEPAVESWKSAFIDSPDYQRGKLVDFMRQIGTWPVPPLILDNQLGLLMPDGCEIARWELIEGHHRLAYLRALAENHIKNLQTEHSIWLITLENNQ